MKKKMTKTKKMRKKMSDFFKTLKPILIFSFVINIVLLVYIYYLKNITHVYLFSGSNEYLQVDSGALSTSYDINYLVGNNIEFVGEEDFKISEIKIGYYIMENEKLNEVISYYEVFEESTNIKDVIENLVLFNVSETKKENNIFKNVNNNLEFNFYLVMEVKNENGPLLTKLQLDVSKLK